MYKSARACKMRFDAQSAATRAVSPRSPDILLVYVSCLAYCTVPVVV